MSISEYKLQQAKKLPPPIPGVEIKIPLSLLPAYTELHKLESKEYREQEEVLVISRSESEPQ